ncbi:MAG: TolB family protein, partial [Acidimicrobiales bacterium]
MRDPTVTRGLLIEDLYRMRVPCDPTLSPDGTLVCFVVTSIDKEQDEARSALWWVATAGGRPEALTDGPADRAPRWSPDGRWIAFLRAKRGDDAGP